MLTGRVTADKEAVLTIEVLGAEGRIAQVEVGIDTGYNGFLTLPKAMIEDLDLAFLGPARAALGDGHEVRMDLFLASVQWDDGLRDVLVLAAEGGPLIGMALLSGYRLVIDVAEGGVVFIEPLAKIRGMN